MLLLFVHVGKRCFGDESWVDEMRRGKGVIGSGLRDEREVRGEEGKRGRGEDEFGEIRELGGRRKGIGARLRW